VDDLLNALIRGTSAVQTFIYQFAVLTKVNRLTLKCFEEKYPLLCGFMLEVVQISPANSLIYYTAYTYE